MTDIREIIDFWEEGDEERFIEENINASRVLPGTPLPPPRVTVHHDSPTGSGPVHQEIGSNQIKTGQSLSSTFTLDDLLRALVEAGSSDLHLTHGSPPMMRKNGDIQAITGFPVLTSELIERLMFAVMSADQQKKFQQTKDVDLAHAIPNVSRFRVNVLQQRHHTGAVVRVIPNEIKSLAQLGMPESLADFAKLPRGLVLVTGPTGSGKSTTLAAIIDAANILRRDHILTIEDPIEFVHQNKNCLINQREVGVDTESFPSALKAALREDPDIILVGEMRDPETISIAITAAETGHLVFGTLHTQSAVETMSRIIDSFPDGSKDQIRAQLAATIQGIVCQTLIKTLDGRGRIAAMEILKGEPGIRAQIRKGADSQINSALETGKNKGMHTLTQHLVELTKADKISIEEGASRAPNPDHFYQEIGGQEAIARIQRRQKQIGGNSYLGGSN